MTGRTLFECSHARVKENHIYCAKGHPLSRKSKPGNGHIDIQRLADGEALALVSCRRCPDFDGMGPPVPPEERGWLEKEGGFKA